VSEDVGRDLAAARVAGSDRRAGELTAAEGELAAIVHQFCQVARHGIPTRVAHLEQPVFAWR
jgi:hypothetical protein